MTNRERRLLNRLAQVIRDCQAAQEALKTGDLPRMWQKCGDAESRVLAARHLCDNVMGDGDKARAQAQARLRG